MSIDLRDTSFQIIWDLILVMVNYILIKYQYVLITYLGFFSLNLPDNNVRNDSIMTAFICC